MKYLLLLVSLFFSPLALAGELDSALAHSAAGIKTQSARMKVIAENIANADSTGTTPGAEPYRRKLISFSPVLDKKTGAQLVSVDKISRDKKTPFQAKFDPSHPAANEEGYVLLPNVKTSIEMLDMKEAERTYEANLRAIETSKKMYTSTIELMR